MSKLVSTDSNSRSCSWPHDHFGPPFWCTATDASSHRSQPRHVTFLLEGARRRAWSHIWRSTGCTNMLSVCCGIRRNAKRSVVTRSWIIKRAPISGWRHHQVKTKDKQIWSHSRSLAYKFSNTQMKKEKKRNKRTKSKRCSTACKIAFDFFVRGSLSCFVTLSTRWPNRRNVPTVWKEFAVGPPKLYIVLPRNKISRQKKKSRRKKKMYEARSLS